jgi:pimeloyl-ACP methyl ester carboxylesterase
MVVDEGAVANLLSSVGPRDDQLQPKALLDAATALKAGDQGPMLQLGNQFSLSLVSGDPVDVFSNGDDAAAFCNDQTFPWDPADSFAVREKKLAAAYAALPANEFQPFTIAGYAAGNPGPDYCIRWPAPNRFEPVIPAGATFPSLPTLIMSGDEDTSAPEEINRILQTEFPKATFVVVAGAGHGSAAPRWGSCGGRAVATFFDTLRVDPSGCATLGG